MGAGLLYILPNGKTGHCDNLQLGLQLLLRTRKAIVWSTAFLAALLPLALAFAFCGKVFFWIGLALLAGDCGLWLALKWAKKPWGMSVELYQLITVEYIKTLTLTSYSKKGSTAEAPWHRRLRGIVGGIAGFLLGALGFPLLIPYRLWKDIGLLMFKLPEFIGYFEEAVAYQEKKREEEQKQQEKDAVYYTGESPW